MAIACRRKFSPSLKSHIHFCTEAEVAEWARFCRRRRHRPRLRPRRVKAGEMVEFPAGHQRACALNLERDNVGVVIFVEDRTIREGDTVSAPHHVDVPSARAFSSRWSTSRQSYRRQGPLTRPSVRV